ncbi:MAG TPA: hypothetical protein VJO53_08370 [Candidatus Acidoferrales bacterium]|nr:hypothetical protein [Candidatus Acidoferrales bacterium]
MRNPFLHLPTHIVSIIRSCGRGRSLTYLSMAGFLLVGGVTLAIGEGSGSLIPVFQEFSDPFGSFATVDLGGPTDTANNAFFQDLGTNGRRCVTCHQPGDAWTVTPAHLQARFDATGGTDPIFRTNDGSGCPTENVSTMEERREAYSLLLHKGLIRIEQNVPANAEFTVLDNDNPYGCGSTSALSAYRRPLPATNLAFLSTVMWDGRETFKNPDGSFKPITFDLADQAVGATEGHAQGPQPTSAQVQQIVDFETKLFTAQLEDRNAGELNDDGARGGPQHLSGQEFFIGINDPLGMNPSGAAFTSKIFDIYRAWSDIDDRDFDEQTEARRSIARGENLFNTLKIPITGVAGLNDVTNQPLIHGFCGTCHDTPNVGDHSVAAPLNIGVADASRRTPDLPLFTVMCNATGKVTQVTDLGRAMVSGKCADIGKFKGPILRGLAGRAPYFHNGSAATLLDVIDFYDTRFDLDLSEQDKADFVAFLKTL